MDPANMDSNVQSSSHRNIDTSRTYSTDDELQYMAIDAIRRVCLLGILWVGAKEFIRQISRVQDDESNREMVKATRKMLMEKLPHRSDLNVKTLEFSNHEISVANDVIASGTLSTKFSMIGGLGDTKSEIMDIVTLACSSDARAQGLNMPRGILLSGPPGTGKTMLAKAVATECGATFVNVKLSVLNNKWVGESEKYVEAIFSLARKLAPSIIFIDEIDGFLQGRRCIDSAHSMNVKTEFMTQWDGLLTERDSSVMVMGTTNRPEMVDPAILRRLPRQFVIGLPATDQARLEILTSSIRRYNLHSDVDLAKIARETAGFSGSDLDALCQAAQTGPAREFAKVIREQQHERCSQQPATQNEGKPNGPRGGDGTSKTGLLQGWISRITGGTLGNTTNVPEPEVPKCVPKMRAIRQADFDTALRNVRPVLERMVAV